MHLERKRPQPSLDEEVAALNGSKNKNSITSWVLAQFTTLEHGFKQNQLTNWA